jgi:thiol-disulfide isomerase/thioredoxin
MATPDQVRLSYEGTLPSLDGATEWLNSDPLTPADLRGHVVVVDFWTFTCINWIRTAPYLRAWDERYREQGLIIIGAHTPEFPFERDVEGIRAAITQRRIRYPVAVDSENGVWDAFANRYWPALYVADRGGAIRFHHFGEGRYDDTERVIQALLDVPEQDVVDLEPDGIEAAADWDTLRSPETYLGYDRAERFGSPGAAPFDERHTYSAPSHLRSDQWALAGDWTVGDTGVVLDEAGGRLLYRFSARDLNLVMGPAEGNGPVRFRVRLDGAEPGDAHGGDTDERGEGVAPDRRLYQLVRQPGEVRERVFEITFLDPGAAAYVFTFG